MIRGRRRRGLDTAPICCWGGMCHRRGWGHRWGCGDVAGSGGGVYGVGGGGDGSGVMSGGMWRERRSAVCMQRRGKGCAGGAF